MISAATLIAVIAVLWQNHKVKQRQLQILHYISMANQSIGQVIMGIKHCNDAEQNTIKALEQICEALNKYFVTATGYMNESACMLQHLAVCMIPIINDVLNQAVKNEDYEKAQACANILSNLKQITKPISE